VNIYQGPTKTIEGISASGYFSFGDLGRPFRRATFAWYDTLRWVTGRHNISLGGSFERDRWNKFNDNGAYGKFCLQATLRVPHWPTGPRQAAGRLRRAMDSTRSTAPFSIRFSLTTTLKCRGG
jgi:hypothetical protein